MAEKQEMALFGGAGPCKEIMAAGAVGNENVDAGDLAIPRISILQSLSPQLDETHAKYIEGAKAGQLAESVSGDVFSQLFVVNLKYKREYTVFKKRTKGGGFLGSYDTAEDAQAALDAGTDGQGNVINPDEYDIVEQGNHLLLMLDETGKVIGPAMMSFSNTALKVSKAWNTQIQKEAKDVARFATVWTLGTAREKNNRGSWFTPKVEFAGFCPAELFQQAQAAYDSLG